MKDFFNKIFATTSSFIKKNSDIIKPVAVLTVICLVISLALAVTNLVTADKIAEIDKKNSEAAMAELLPSEKYEEVDLTAALPATSSYSPADTQFFIAYEGDTVKGYLITTAAKGYGGDVKVMTAISPDKKVIGVNILSAADETPGLGQNVTKEDFYSQFIDKSENITVVKNGAVADKNEINAVTGATITSTAVKNCVNDAFICLNEYINASAATADTTVADEAATESEVQ